MARVTVCAMRCNPFVDKGLRGPEVVDFRLRNDVTNLTPRTQANTYMWGLMNLGKQQDLVEIVAYLVARIQNCVVSGVAETVACAKLRCGMFQAVLMLRHCTIVSSEQCFHFVVSLICACAHFCVMYILMP